MVKEWSGGVGETRNGFLPNTCRNDKKEGRAAIDNGLKHKITQNYPGVKLFIKTENQRKGDFKAKKRVGWG